MKTLRKLRRSDSVFVGPDFGKTAKEGADGYYFAMAYGSKSRYLNQLLIPSGGDSQNGHLSKHSAKTLQNDLEHEQHNKN
jgi:hypothetical protein